MKSRLITERTDPGSFQGATHENGVPIAKVFMNALWAAFSTVNNIH